MPSPLFPVLPSGRVSSGGLRVWNRSLIAWLRRLALTMIVSLSLSVTEPHDRKDSRRMAFTTWTGTLIGRRRRVPNAESRNTVTAYKNR